MNRRTIQKVDRQMSALNFIRAYRQANGQSPTIQEIADRLDVSIATVSSYLDGLVRANLITRKKHANRGIDLVVAQEPAQ